jgi:glycosyltransferase involved in cell wall biosynthesis
VTRLLFAIPGDISALTGGYEYDRRILRAGRDLGAEILHVPLPGAFPFPTPPEIEEAIDRIDRAIQPGDVVLIDGLALGALPHRHLKGLRAPVIALCHHPLCLESGLDAGCAATLRESERRALAASAHVIVTSPHTRQALTQDFDVPEAKITVARPGTDPAVRACGTGSPVSLLAVGALIPRKGFQYLVEALSDLGDLDWRLDIVGADDHAPPTARRLRDQLSRFAASGKMSAGKIRLVGACAGDTLQTLYDRADVFVSPSLYEGYGMALAEALARGLAIIATTGGAASETVPEDARLSVPPADAAALRSALRRVISEAPLRRRLSDAAWRAGQNLPRWDAAARTILEAAREAKAT